MDAFLISIKTTMMCDEKIIDIPTRVQNRIDSMEIFLDSKWDETDSIQKGLLDIFREWCFTHAPIFMDTTTHAQKSDFKKSLQRRLRYMSLITQGIFTSPMMSSRNLREIYHKAVAHKRCLLKNMPYTSWISLCPNIPIDCAIVLSHHMGLSLKKKTNAQPTYQKDMSPRAEDEPLYNEFLVLSCR